uniref:Uncharacterized protein n=1 Tax=Lepeophtheirus salmonis TaxID=72036 RepID=A0A0K2VIP7_LEPSM
MHSCGRLPNFVVKQRWNHVYTLSLFSMYIIYYEEILSWSITIIPINTFNRVAS